MGAGLSRRPQWVARAQSPLTSVWSTIPQNKRTWESETKSPGAKQSDFQTTSQEADNHSVGVN